MLIKNEFFSDEKELITAGTSSGRSLLGNGSAIPTIFGEGDNENVADRNQKKL